MKDPMKDLTQKLEEQVVKYGEDVEIVGKKQFNKLEEEVKKYKETASQWATVGDRVSASLLIGGALSTLGYGIYFLIGLSEPAPIRDLYKFQYKEQPAMVQSHEKVARFDEYWIKIGEDKIFDGRLTTDRGKVVYIGSESPQGPYTIKEKN